MPIRALLPLVVVLFLASAGALAVAPGELAPAFALPTASGETIALERLKGQVVYVDFWASWCGPCRRSFPWMNEMHRKYAGKGFAIVAVNVDRKRADADRFLAQFPAEFPVVYDTSGTTPTAFAVKGMPSSYLIDTAGKVIAIEQGFRDEQGAALETRIRALIAK